MSTTPEGPRDADPGGDPPPAGGYPPPPPSYPDFPPPPPGYGGYPPPPPNYGSYPPPPPNYGSYPPPPPASGGYPPAPGFGGYPPASGFGPGQPKGWTPFGQATGWWQRVGATIIDVLVLVVPLVLLLFIGRGLGELIYLVIQAGYVTILLSRSGQTLGNRAVGTRVINAETGQIPTTGRALGRWAAGLLFNVLSFLFLIPLLLDILWPLWDSRNQTLHDKLAGTLVIKTN